MRWCIPLLFVAVCCPPVSSQILINEIYYDHPGRDDGYEFIELINVGGSAEGLLGYALEFHDGSGTGWKLVWQPGVPDSLAAGALMVIGGVEVRPSPDHVINLVLQNGPDALRLTRDGIAVDRVGYGALSDPQYFEGESAPDAPEGFSLGRYPDGFDTNYNATDFRRLEPSPGVFNQAHHDGVLFAGDGTAQAAVASDVATNTIRIKLINEGTHPIGEGMVDVVLRDSSAFFEGLIDSTVNAWAIPPGDSLELVFLVLLGSGYHHLTAVADYPLDERPDNNVVRLLRRAGDPRILISEVMSHPAGACPEYVEVYNAGALLYEFVDHWIRDAAHAPGKLGSLGRAIAPGEYIVVTRNKSSMLECFPGLGAEAVVEAESGWPSLNHSGSGPAADSVLILDQYLLPVDAVAYPPQPSDTRGRSLERVDLFSGHRSHTWVLSSSATGGSPGQQNTRAIFAVPAPNRVTIHPNPFIVNAGERLLITVSARSEPSRSVVQLFDIEGRVVRALGSSDELPIVFVWDGSDESGRTVPPGIYVVACEFYSLATGNRTVERVVVGCGSKGR